MDKDRYSVVMVKRKMDRNRKVKLKKCGSGFGRLSAVGVKG